MATRKSVKVYSESGWTARAPQGVVQGSGRLHARAYRRRGTVRADATISHAGRAARKEYSRMYEQEEKDIAKAVGILEKYAR